MLFLELCVRTFYLTQQLRTYTIIQCNTKNIFEYCRMALLCIFSYFVFIFVENHYGNSSRHLSISEKVQVGNDQEMAQSERYNHFSIFVKYLSCFTDSVQIYRSERRIKPNKHNRLQLGASFFQAIVREIYPS